MQITLEHAISYEEQAIGLMYRSSLPRNHGMAFSYNSMKRRTFWSQNCLLDLDVAFLDSHHRIQEIHYLPRKPTTKITSMKPAQYVVEMEAGFFQTNNIQVGDYILWQELSQEASISRQPAPALQKK